ncbi:MAG TPA: hypothetical protein VFP65_27195 [Anaeromyxobacteraceae bacterium]|nr:hypothetical protein [Anaeromyxobacteraceae bacterium]
MPATLHYFTLPDDERALFRVLGRQGLTVYPELIPPGFAPPAAAEEAVAGLADAAYYLAAERFGPVIVHPVKRGPDRGMLVVEEIPSPVLHYQRSRLDERGELVGGRLWAELDVTDDPGSKLGKHRGLRAIFNELHDWMRKTFRRSDPKGYWVGAAAARAWKTEHLVLREPGHKGRSYGVWR